MLVGVDVNSGVDVDVGVNVGVMYGVGDHVGDGVGGKYGVGDAVGVKYGVGVGKIVAGKSPRQVAGPADTPWYSMRSIIKYPVPLASLNNTTESELRSVVALLVTSITVPVQSSWVLVRT